MNRTACMLIILVSTSSLGSFFHLLTHPHIPIRPITQLPIKYLTFDCKFCYKSLTLSGIVYCTMYTWPKIELVSTLHTTCCLCWISDTMVPMEHTKWMPLAWNCTLHHTDVLWAYSCMIMQDWLPACGPFWSPGLLWELFTLPFPSFTPLTHALLLPIR